MARGMVLRFLEPANRRSCTDCGGIRKDVLNPCVCVPHIYRDRTGHLAARDPHHEGRPRWKYDPANGKLFCAHDQGAKWREVKRVSFTPVRLMILAELIEKTQAEFEAQEPEGWDT